MVLQALYTLASNLLPSRYYIHAFIAVVSLVITYAFAQGRTTTRERDLHARVILVTGAFSPAGMTLVSSLASRGAHIIALSPYPLDHPQPSLLIPILRTTTNNENIYAEYANLNSPASIREFCTRFLTGNDQRLDAILFAHEYHGIGSLFTSNDKQEELREASALATFLIITLLLPALLVAPVERDIRVINVVNPFYAAATPSFTSTLVKDMASPSDVSAKSSIFLREGHRALRTIVLTRHLQRILNALPNRAPTLDPKLPGADEVSQETSAPSAQATDTKHQNNHPSNIVAVSVCPGISRTETIRSLLGTDREVDPNGWSILGLLLYIALFPILWLLSKSSSMAIQSVLHTLFLPTPFKRALAHLNAAADPSSARSVQSQSGKKASSADSFTEVLKPGALYRECSVVTLVVPKLPDATEENGGPTNPKPKRTGKGKEKDDKDDIIIEDDGEMGGEAVGRVVWEWYENRLKGWEVKEKGQEKQGDTDKTGNIAGGKAFVSASTK